VTDPARVAVFAPNPLLTVTVERRGEGSEEVHLHPGGQGVWVARMAAELGAEPILCGFSGGETGRVLGPLLERLPGELRLTRTASGSGCLVFDRREGERRVIANTYADPPSRHEIDDLLSATVAAALEADVLAICNPYPGEALPLEVYGNLAADAGENGTTVLVDLSSPRLEAALGGRPDAVKINDWELAAFVRDPVDTPERLRDAAERLIEAGAGAAVITRGPEPALVLKDGIASWLVPPRFERGSREGCGDSMMGALAACLGAGMGWEDALVRATAAGAVNFLRHGLGTGERETIDEVAERVELRPF
jgi:1-phosphofructokinase